MPARAGKAKADAGKHQRPKRVDRAPVKKGRRPRKRHVEPLFSTYDAPKPKGATFDKKAADQAVKWIEGLRHFKGRWAGEPFYLLDWQQRLVREIFGWKLNGARLYRNAYVEAPRKSGKTSLAAAIALYLAYGDGEAAPEVFFAAYDKDQAKLCYSTARYMLEQDADLYAQTVIYNSKSEMLLRDNPGGFLRCLSKESGKQYGLNPHGIVFDELMTQKTREMWDALSTAQGAREQSLQFNISTAGWDQLSVCFEQHELVRQISEGTTNDPTFFGVVYGAPMDADWTDEKVWLAANPSLGQTASVDFYRERCTKAKNQPTEQNAFRTLLLSQWVGQAERFIPMEGWDACDDEPPKPDGRRAYGGLDLSATTDLTAFAVVSQRDQVLDIYCHAFLPAEGIIDRERRDKAPYRVWAEQGFLTLTPGRTVDYGAVKASVRDAAEQFDLEVVEYDRWNATATVQELEAEGIRMEDLGQGFASQSAPCKELLRLILNEEIAHGGNPLLRWCASNVAARMDPAGNVKLDKDRSAHRIDPVQAVVNAIDGWMRFGQQPSSRSVYEDRGLIAA